MIVYTCLLIALVIVTGITWALDMRTKGRLDGAKIEINVLSARAKTSEGLLRTIRDRRMLYYRHPMTKEMLDAIDIACSRRG